MSHWIFAAQPHALAASQMIARLGARAMFYRGGWQRDGQLRAIGRDLLGRWHPETAVDLWDTPRETTAGAWAIRDPSSAVLVLDGARVLASDAMLTEAPAVLARVGGLPSVDWASVYRDMQIPYAPGDEDTEITLPAVAWVRAAMLASGLQWSEGAAEFPPEDDL